MTNIAASTEYIQVGMRPSRKPSVLPWYQQRCALVAVFISVTGSLFLFLGAFDNKLAPPSAPLRRPIERTPQLVVTLPGYGSFQGTQVSASSGQWTPFQSPVDAWLGVEYSTQPVGQDRLKPADWPKPFSGLKDATSSGPACWQNLYSSLSQSEACLTIDVYRPSGVPLDQKLPSLVYIHGGSFVSGSHSSFDGALFVEKSAQPLMVVTIQYRLGALGSLPAEFMASQDLLNLDIRDQKMALEFLQKYIANFGGDPEKITLGGQSAGGHSVGIHLFHNYGTDAGKPLFHQAILSSGSPTARAFPGYDYPLYQRQVEQFLDYLNCPSSPPSASLACLRGAEIDDLQFISSSLYNAHNYNITWPWQPVSPGPLFEKRGSISGSEKTFFKIPILISSCTNEGNGFVPQDLRTDKQFQLFWTTLTPGLTGEDITDLEYLYPQAGNLSVPSTSFVSPQYQRVAASYSDYSYICPVQDTASLLASTGAPVYKARFNTPNWTPEYMGVPHASDAGYFNGREDTQYPEIAAIYAAYWASFIVDGDPNTYRHEGSATWDTYSGTGGKQLVVDLPSAGGPKMEDEGVAIRMDQCAWWRDFAREQRLNK